MIGFHDIIQAYFTRLTGRLVIFSGRDMALLERWRSEGATAVAICRGVRDAVMHLDQSKPPRDVHTCRDFIEPYIARARQRGARAPSEFSSEAVFGVASLSVEAPDEERDASRALSERRVSVALQALCRIERAGHLSERAEVRALYREAWYVARGAALLGSAEEQYGALLELEEQLCEAYFEALDARARARLERRVISEVQANGLRMSEEAWRAHKAARRRHLLMSEHGLISLWG